MSRSKLWSIVAASALVAAAAANPPAALAQREATRATPAAKSEPAAAADDNVARGRYLVENVATCWRCHSPVNASGERDRSRWLLGGQVGMTPTVPSDWAIVAPRLAGSPPGTDEQFVHLLMTGISRNGHYLRPPMPQFRLSQADAEAVLAYLKALGARPGGTH